MALDIRLHQGAVPRARVFSTAGQAIEDIDHGLNRSAFFLRIKGNAGASEFDEPDAAPVPTGQENGAVLARHPVHRVVERSVAVVALPVTDLRGKVLVHAPITVVVLAIAKLHPTAEAGVEIGEVLLAVLDGLGD